MGHWFRRWFRDTLFLRLFLLMWFALVASHIAAFGVVTSGLFGRALPGGFGLGQLPTFPSLPPTPGLPDKGPIRREPPHRQAPPYGPPPEQITPGFSGGPPPGAAPFLSPSMLAVDYLVRIVLIGIAAAIGARWLSQPVRRLVDASRRLSTSLGTESALPSLDEAAGTVEVRESARVFNRMARELDAQFKARGLLMASLSHDLKTPLTRMRMRLENESEQAFVQRCIDDIREMSDLLDTALDVFRSAANDEPLQAIDVHALLQSITDDRSEQGQAVTLRGSSALALARPVALRRVVSNLVENALRYGGRADIEVAADAGSVRVGIDDSGPGIPEELHEAVFRPFFRVEGSRNRAGGGSGLGLYIARDLLRRQGGELTLRNRSQGGLHVQLVVPAFRGDLAM